MRKSASRLGQFCAVEIQASRKLTSNIHSSHGLNRAEAKRFRVKLTDHNQTLIHDATLSRAYCVLVRKTKAQKLCGSTSYVTQVLGLFCNASAKYAKNRERSFAICLAVNPSPPPPSSVD